ncbi:MAG: transglutaminase-like domain-containing protein [Bacteroidota bacterium]|nr:transglutaminase-like domain-containing protein [Bacteroidota bacterium]
MDSIALLTHWVADEIRYSGISMGEGEGYTLHTGEMNFEDRCGVCKDKAGMLITMLRSAGFESYPAMTMAGSRIDYIPADQFNHCVTLVKKKDGEYELLDPTWVPFIRELWSSAEQQQNYLPGIPEGSDLKITPLSDPENHYFKMNGKSEILPDGTLKGWMELEAEGQTDASIRRYFVRNYKAEWDKNLIQEFLNVSPKAILSKIEYSDPYDYQSGPINIRFEYEIPDYAIVTDEEIIFDPLIASGLFKGGMSHLYINTNLDKREYPFRDRCSRLVELNESIKVPEGYTKSGDKLEMNFGDDVSSFSGAIDAKDNHIQIREKVELGKRIYEPEDYEAFKKAVQAQKDFASQKIILVKSK